MTTATTTTTTMMNMLFQQQQNDYTDNYVYSAADEFRRALQEEEDAETLAPTTPDDPDMIIITPSDKTSMELFNAIMSNILLFFLIFGLSATVDLKSIKKQLTNKFAIGLGVAMQFIIMPILGFVATISLRNYGLSQAMGITLLVVTSSPGGSFSNWWCSTFNAELALSVAMTTVSSLLSIALLPANLFLYTYLAFGIEDSIVKALDFGAIFTTLAVVMGAIISGLYAGYRFDNKKFHVYANRFGSVSGLALILFSLFLSSGADGADSNFWNQPWAFYVGVAFPCLVGMALANIVSRSLRLSPPETVAISIECCYQNTGIATSVAITMFDDKNERAQAVAVPLFYGIVEAIAIGIYCVWAWKVGWTKAPKNENICVVVTKTYEVHDDGDADQDVEQGQVEVDVDGEIIEYTPPVQPSAEPNRSRADDSTSHVSEDFENDIGVITESTSPSRNKKEHTATSRTEASSSDRDDNTPNSSSRGGFWARILPRWGTSSRTTSTAELTTGGSLPSTRSEDNDEDDDDDDKEGKRQGGQSRKRLATETTADTCLSGGESSCGGGSPVSASSLSSPPPATIRESSITSSAANDIENGGNGDDVLSESNFDDDYMNDEDDIVPSSKPQPSTPSR